MSAQRKARDEARRLARFQRLVISLATPRNPVVAAIVHRAVAQPAGPHIRTHSAQRRADKVALRKQPLED